MESELPKITGRLIVHASYATDGMVEHAIAALQGGDVIAVTEELLEQADPKYIRWLDDEVLLVCQLKFKKLGRDHPRDWYVFQLVAEEQSEETTIETDMLPSQAMSGTLTAYAWDFYRPDFGSMFIHPNTEFDPLNHLTDG